MRPMQENAHCDKQEGCLYVWVSHLQIHRPESKILKYICAVYALVFSCDHFKIIYGKDLVPFALF